ncbi:GNAT family N-acetyltransferase [Aeromicrobium duanguangcaii]|uniref:GNAT family N-acetyltransferase n=1 Tax=Aeromicrobium duanguangcaii TaxID=2968086 RepID=A0ABY5KFM1_9ACTN|nr:GNAT family protein [Aeromicrobium duanguangcaii]MCD9152827.1 GNAT family N-acetyltransferase [Aeromicrobium duanguangcaii]MCL3837171.1 GNAT family N-acetyltransferase [Aeromicrobium duanguangcaii]UUI67193.1 GNAT family N-acetyltransferase [Aeromicrobium duanguangcaii]
MPVTRLVAATDAEALADVLSRNREAMAAIEPRRPSIYFTTKGQRAIIQDALRRYSEGLAFPRVILDDDTVVGRINLSEIVQGPARRAELGYYLDAKAQGRGLATRAIDEIVTLAFGRLGLHRIQAATRLDNAASQRILERNDFARVGIARDYLRVGGAWRDHVLYERIAAQ